MELPYNQNRSKEIGKSKYSAVKSLLDWNTLPRFNKNKNNKIKKNIHLLVFLIIEFIIRRSLDPWIRDEEKRPVFLLIQLNRKFVIEANSNNQFIM